MSRQNEGKYNNVCCSKGRTVKGHHVVNKQNRNRSHKIPNVLCKRKKKKKHGKNHIPVFPGKVQICNTENNFCFFYKTRPHQLKAFLKTLSGTHMNTHDVQNRVNVQKPVLKDLVLYNRVSVSHQHDRTAGNM